MEDGKAVAELVPCKVDKSAKVPHWKLPIEPLSHQRTDGKTISQLVIEERENARY
mgnify:CR=1 FL=1